MLMTTKANQYAHALLKARTTGALHPLISTGGKLSIDDAYDIARSLLTVRIAQGETPVGRKIGFSNDRVRARYGKTVAVAEPIWSTLFDSTVSYAMNNVALHELGKAQQPRLEPHLVFKLARTPAPQASLTELADSLEWMAHGLEVVVSPYKDWDFDASDAIAAFGLNRMLVVGEPRMLSRHGRHQLPEVLAAATLSLSKTASADSGIAAAGYGSDLMGSPLQALLSLHRQLQQQPAFSPLQAGEIVATGSWTEAFPVRRGEVWTSAFAQLNLPGLSLSFS